MSENTVPAAQDSDGAYVNVRMSNAFKSAFETWCDTNGYKVMTRAAQKAIASMIGYDLSTEPEPKTRSKYGADEKGKVDRETAKLTNSFKGAEQTRLLRAAQKAKIAKNSALVAELDAELDTVYADDWAPSLEKRIEIRRKAIATLVEKKEIPSDYTDDTLDDMLGEILEPKPAK